MILVNDIRSPGMIHVSRLRWNSPAGEKGEMMTKIKICGLTRVQDILFVNEAMPDYAGFILHFPRSRRNLSPADAAALRRLLAPGIQTAGVFVDQPAEYVLAAAEQIGLNVIQLHGQEDETYIRKLRSFTDVPVIKAFQVGSREDIKRAEDSSADYVLLDSGTGSGQLFDWKLLTHIQRPYFLAGGLTPENVGEAIKLLHPFAVDVSSGIETEGAKDYEKMAAFAAAVRKEG